MKEILMFYFLSLAIAVKWTKQVESNDQRMEKYISLHDPILSHDQFERNTLYFSTSESINFGLFALASDVYFVIEYTSR